MIAPMTKYTFILLNGTQGDLLERLQEMGLVDITRSAKAVDKATEELMADIDLVDGLIQGLSKVEIPEGTVPEAIDGDIVRLTGGMLMRYAEDRDEIKRLNAAINDYKVWGNYDATILQELNEAGVIIHFHVLSNKKFKAEWADSYALTVVHADKKRIWFLVAGEDRLPGEVPAPTISLEELEERLQEKEKHYRKVLGRLAGAMERIGELEAHRKDSYERLDVHLAGAAAVPAAEDTIVTLVGYAPTEKDAEVSASLDASGVFYFKDAAVAEDHPPISLKNNWFVRQFETLTDMYGRPEYDGFDPTPFISIFFLLFFAFCMGDAGYGLVLILVGLLLKKVKSFASLAPLVVVLGIGTTVIGLIFHTFFSMDMLTWSWIPDGVKKCMLPSKIAGYDGTMVLALVVGIVHLCVALVVKAIYATKHEGFAKTVGTWGWTLLIVGGAIVGGIALAGVLDKAVTKWVLIGLGIVSALAIFPLNNLKRNPLVNTGLGLWDTYQTVTGLLGDVLSYLRLYALGLAGAMLGFAFNSIGQMALGDGSSVGGWIGFILIVLIGHTLNLAMCALGAFVHPLRLNFLEFFKNSGYETSPRNYTPLQKTNNNQ